MSEGHIEIPADSAGETVVSPLRESEREWQMAFDAIRDLVMILDDEFRIVRANAANASFYNLPEEKIPGSRCYCLMHGTTSPFPGCPVQKAMSTRKHEEAEIHDEKNDRWLLVSVDPIPDEAGHVTRILHTVRDITEHKRAELALAESEERFRLATEAVRGTVYDVNWQSGTLDCSEGLVLDTGYRLTDLPLTVAWGWDQVHPEDRQKIVEQTEDAFSKRLSVQTHEFRVRQKDGRYIWVEDKHRILYTPDGQPLRLIGCTTSIDDRKKAEQQLKESEQRLRLAAQAARMFAFEWDPSTDQIVRSAECAGIVGLDSRCDTGQAYLAMIHDDDRTGLLQVRNELTPAHPDYRTSYRLIRADGQVLWLEESSHGSFDASGRLTKLIGMAVDVTDRRNAEEEVRQLRDNLAKWSRISLMGELTATIAHELNQPLGAVITNAQACQRLLDRPAPELGEIRAALADIIADGSRANAVVCRVRSVLQRGEVPKARVDLNTIVRSVVPMLRSHLSKDHIALTQDLDSDIPPVIGSFGQLQQVILNLVLNAADAVMPCAVSSRRIRLVSRIRANRMVSVAVEDSGVGVSAEYLQRLFEPYFTTKPDGMGMGLPISRSIVENHGGQLWAESDGHSGSVFEFTIPAAEDLPA